MFDVGFREIRVGAPECEGSGCERGIGVEGVTVEDEVWS